MKIEATPRGLLTVFFRQKMKFLLAFFLILYGGMLFIILSTPLYESRGAVLIRFGNDSKPDVAKSERSPTEVSQNDRNELMQSYIEIMYSHDLLHTLVNEFGATRLYPPLAHKESSPEGLTEIAIDQLIKHDLVVKPSQQSNIIEVNVRNQDPLLAMQFAHRLFQRFIARQSEMYNSPQMDFINEQLKHAADQLADSQQKLKKFKDAMGITTIEGEMAQLLQEKSEVQSSALESINEAQSKLDDMKTKEAEMLMTYWEGSKAIKQLHRSIDAAEQQLNDRRVDLKTGTGLNYGDSNTVSQDNTYTSHIADIDKRIHQLEIQHNQYDDLTRQMQMAADNYTNYQARLEEARINATLNQQNITRILVLDEATLPLKPAYPNKSLVSLLSIVAGGLFGFVLVVAFETIDQRFSTPEQVARFLPVPMMVSFAALGKKLRIATSTTPLLSNTQARASSSTIASTRPIKLDLPITLPPDQLLGLCQMIISTLPEKLSRIVQFVSSYHNERVDVIAFETAIIAATQLGMRVLFIDTAHKQHGIRQQLANAVRTPLHKLLRTDGSFNNTLVSVSDTSFVYTTLYHGDHTNNSLMPDLEYLANLLHQLRGKYDLILLPSPAVLGNALPKALAKLADGSVMVIRANYTRLPVVLQATDSIVKNGGQLIGTILNERLFYIPRWLYRWI